MTVYETGTTTLATIYKDGNNTPLSNPFTSNAVNGVNPGGWLFFAATNQGYDVCMSGGISPNRYPQPVCLTDQFPSSQFVVPGVTQIVAGTNVTISPSSGLGPVTISSGGAYLPLVGGTLTGALNAPSVNASVNAIINVKAAPYNATGNGTTDDTTAVLAAITAAKAASTGVYFPVGIYLVSQTLDSSGISIEGADRFLSIVKMNSADHLDVFQTEGNSRISNLGIDGGWNGSTTGLSGNGISTLSNPGGSPPYYGYMNIFENLNIQNTNKYCIYINDGAYESLHNVKCNASGLDSLYLDSGNYSGYQTTSTAVTGQSTFSDTPNGYGIVIDDGVDISIVGTTTLENTEGIEILGTANRNITLENIYQEGNAGKFLTATGSAGMGLHVINNFGPGTTGTSYADVSAWPQFSFVDNDFSNPGSRNVPQTLQGSTNTDPVNRIAGDFTFNTSTETAIGIAPVTAAVPWSASFSGNWVNAAVHNMPAQTIEISSANPTITVGTTTWTFSVSSGGIFQGIVSVPGSGTGAYEFIGTINLSSDKNTSTSDGLALKTSDGIQGGMVNATTGYQCNGSYGTSGQVLETTGTGCQWVANGSSFITSLTTTGSSGAATVTSGVLNIPVYAGGVADVTISIPSFAIPANTCYGSSGSTTPATVTMTGLTVSPQMAVLPSFTGNASAITGWGATGGLNLQAWASAANTASYLVCNPTAASITGGAISLILAAK